MKKIKIAVYTKNANYGKALARGLLEESSGLEIECIREFYGSAEEYDIVLTDLESLSGAEILVLSDENAKDRGQISKTDSVTKIFEKILEVYLKTTGRMFAPQGITDVTIIGVSGQVGGAGATSAAIILGRHLALKSDRNVLYISFAQGNDYEIYAETDFEDKKSQRELLFRLDSGNTDLIQKYAARDLWGLYMLKPDALYSDESTEKLLNYLCSIGFFSHIIIDAGKNDRILDMCQEVLLIKNCLDSRCGGEEGIYNFASSGGEDRIRNDRDSFKKTDGKIHISMEGTFAEDVEKLADAYMPS